MGRTFVDKSSICWDSRKEQCFESVAASLSDSMPTSKSLAELVNEIATLEFEIMQLERYLLSLYRTVFQQQFPCSLGNQGTSLQKMSETPQVKAEKLSPIMELDMLKGFNDNQSQSSPSSAFAHSNDLMTVATPKSSSRREKNNVYSPHGPHRSLAYHLGNSRIDDALNYPDRLSVEIIRCISSIYCKLANPTPTQKGYSVSSTSSFRSSSTFSPRDLSGSWSPQCNDEVTEHYDFEGLKQENGPYAAMIEVRKLCLDDESYNYAAKMLQKFRSLVKGLEKVDPKKMRRKEKLAFWIDIHNALVMHAYLAYGTQNYIKSTSIMKAAYNVDGHSINAYDIQSSILGIRPHYSTPWLQTLLSPGKKFKTGSGNHPYAIEYPELLVHFALCSRADSDPAVRLYTANNVLHDLKVAKEEHLLIVTDPNHRRRTNGSERRSQDCAQANFPEVFRTNKLNVELKKSFDKMFAQNRHRCLINLAHFYHFREGSDLARRLLQNPSEYVQPLCDSVTDMVRGMNAKYLKEGEQIMVGLEGPFVSRRVTPRELLSGFIGSMSQAGTTDAGSVVRPKVVKSVHFCPATEKFTLREYRDITSNMGLPTGSMYPTQLLIRAVAVVVEAAVPVAVGEADTLALVEQTVVVEAH
ncbi:Hypothetical predicted protein [Olea europaea subsp. europaea]|nr:Hypothetical predicted protein [Olea europaea subsp. europaea]